jgi:hypothetical protein
MLFPVFTLTLTLFGLRSFNLLALCVACCVLYAFTLCSPSILPPPPFFTFYPHSTLSFTLVTRPIASFSESGLPTAPLLDCAART